MVPAYDDVMEDRKAAYDSATMATVDEEAQYAAYQKQQWADRVLNAYWSIFEQEGELQVDGITYSSAVEARDAREKYAIRIVNEADALAKVAA